MFHRRGILTKRTGAILNRPVFERLLFAQCWEDPRLDREALRIQPGDGVLSVTSGGCNTLALALLGPARVVSVDLNHAQSWLLELKLAGARLDDHGAYLELLGVRPSRRRLALYRSCRDGLSPEARAFWDENRTAIGRGVLRSGRYERYLELFRKLLTVMQGPARIHRLFELETAEERRRFYETEWDTRAWRLFFRVFFSRAVLGRGGLDPAFFTYVDGIDDFGEHFRSLARHALCDLPARDNYFLAQICLGRYLNERALPAYLRPENFAALREAAPRVEVVTAELGTYLASQPDDAFDAFNFSNVFEWVSPPVFEKLLGETHRVARPNARLCYRNLLVRRRHPPSLNDRFRPEDDLAAALLRRDRSFVYSHFEVASVRKGLRPKEEHHAHHLESSHSSVDAGRSGLRDDRRAAALRR